MSSSKYEKSMTREEEGSYHRREVECSPQRGGSGSGKTTTYYTQVVPIKQSKHKQQQVSKIHHSSDDDSDNFDEWTTSKRKVNHKTRQVETRVSRQLLVEDGKVIADSGPQVTTRIKEDNKVEECEKEKQPKNKSKFEALENAPEGESTGRVLGEKKELQRTSREVREENMQYHDERFKELTGHDVHRRAIQAPHELITINDSKSSQISAPRGKMVHYSNKGKKYFDTDEILEVAKLAIDGSITKEVKRTKHHEEVDEDEKPDETGEAEALRHAPTVTRSSRRHVDYVNDFNDTSTPNSSSGEEEDDDRNRSSRKHISSDSRAGRRFHTPTKASKHSTGGSRKTHKVRGDGEEAFPRYEIDPLLNSLKDEDFKPLPSRHSSTNRSYREHALIQRESSDTEEPPMQAAGRSNQRYYSQRQRSPSPQRAVEIPEEYRVNKQRLLTSKNKPTACYEHERSFSPTSKSQLSQRSSKSHRSRKEDAAVQAHLTDEEEIERKSMVSSSDVNPHEKTTKHLQRQSTANSQRNYYFGEARQRNQHQHHRGRSLSSSSSSLSDPKERMRKNGARSKDSGFKSPHSMRTVTPSSTGSQQQIYSVSSKQAANKKNRDQRVADQENEHYYHEGRQGAVSPTPTSGSMGQRSVKTTTTTLAAGLEDRPLSRSARSTSGKDNNNKVKEKEKSKVSKPPSPFQKLSQLFAPSSQKKRPVAS